MTLDMGFCFHTYWIQLEISCPEVCSKLKFTVQRLGLDYQALTTKWWYRKEVIRTLLKNIGGPEAILLALMFLLFFGAKKLPELAKGVGDSIREVKKATKE